MITKRIANRLNKLMCDLNPVNELWQKAVMANIDGRQMQCMFFGSFIIGLYDKSELIETHESSDAEKGIQKYLTTKLPEAYNQISFSLDDIKAAQEAWKNREQVAGKPKTPIVQLGGKFFNAELVQLILETLTNRDGQFAWCQTVESVHRMDYIETDNGIAVLCPQHKSVASWAINVPVDIMDEVR